MRIGILGTSNATWMGGISYHLNLLRALEQYGTPSQACLLMPYGATEIFRQAPRVLTRYTLSYHGKLLTQMNRLVRRVMGYDLLLARDLAKIPGGVDVIFPGYHRVDRSTPVVWWISDFQHVHLPEMFAEWEFRSRNRAIREGEARVTLVVVSSEDARRDLKAVAPEFADKARVMTFVAWVPPTIYDVDPRTVVSRYNLPAKFIYLPNQFWKHKNHAIVIKALKILKDIGIEPTIVCTGSPDDYRHPTYYDELLQNVTDWQLKNQIKFLGLVPYEHVYALIRQGVCVVNPSLFEGWSTTVEEAKSVGKRTLLSDLAVHREQNPAKAVYFDPRNAEDLAEKIANVWCETPPGPDTELEQTARAELAERMRKFAQSFISIMRQAVELARA